LTVLNFTLTLQMSLAPLMAHTSLATHQPLIANLPVTARETYRGIVLQPVTATCNSPTC
jgi:hypothetical protein